MKMPMMALALALMSAPAFAATFVYVSKAEDGTIGIYTLAADGSLRGVLYMRLPRFCRAEIAR